MTPFDLIEYMRNCGYRMLDEPSDCEAVFAKGTDGSVDFNSNLYAVSSYPAESYVRDGDTTNPITVKGQEVTVTEGDYIRVKNYQNDDPAVPSTYYLDTVLYVYTANNKWELAESQWNGRTYLDVCGGYHEPTGHWQEDGDNLMVFLDHDDNLPIYNFDENIDEVEFTSYNLFIRPRRTDEPVSPDFPSYVGVGYYWKQKISKDTTNNKYEYGWADDQPEHLEDNPPGEKVYDSSVYVPSYGDEASIFTIDEEGGYKWYTWYTWQYPGFWLNHENKSYPLLDVHIESSSKPYVQLKWSDPPDIDTWEPYPCAWEGTVIIRKEDSAPLHRWDGEKVVLNKTRDKYKTKGYKDENIKMGRTYYYGFFPYYTADNSDPDHPIRYYTFTKVIKVETGDNSIASTIDSIDVNGNTATIKYTLSQPDSATFASVKIYGKIGSNPSCDDTDDVVVDADPEAITKDIPNLEYESTYYFCLVTVDSNDEELSSNIMSCTIGEDESRHLYPRVKLNNEANKYTFDQALINWYNAGLNEQRSYIDGYVTDHIQITNDYYKIHNGQESNSGVIDFGGGWTFYYSYSANQHTYNRDFRTIDFRLKYNETDVSTIYGGSGLAQDVIFTFSNNGNGTASLIMFMANPDYMYNQIYKWETSCNVFTPNGNNAILFHDYLKAHQKI